MSKNKLKKESLDTIKFIGLIIIIIVVFKLVFAFMPPFNQYNTFDIQTDSMDPVIAPGDFVVVRYINPDDIEVGDIMAFNVDITNDGEDDRVVSKTIEHHLIVYGYKVDCVFNAEDGLLEVNKREYSAIVLDLNLPKLSGYSFIQILRKKSDIPIVINTAHASVESRVKLINAGASDFIEKSMHPNDIVESIKIILEERKKMKERSKSFEFNDIIIDFSNRTVMKNDKLIDLTSKEIDILKTLLDNPTRAFSKKQLYLVVWGEEYSEQVDNTINVHIKRLRNKIEVLPKSPEIIETVYAYGYRLGKSVVSMLQDGIKH